MQNLRVQTFYLTVELDKARFHIYVTGPHSPDRDGTRFHYKTFVESDISTLTQVDRSSMPFATRHAAVGSAVQEIVRRYDGGDREGVL